jgi:hypothetical protein
MQLFVLKKYRKCFKVPSKGNACKELLSVDAKHFLQLKVDEAKFVKSYIEKVRRCTSFQIFDDAKHMQLPPKVNMTPYWYVQTLS